MKQTTMGLIGAMTFMPPDLQVVDWGDAHRNLPGTPGKIRTEPKINRNEKCPCGSGIKFKKCCLEK